MKKIITFVFMLMGALTTYAQIGYWFQSKFIEFTPNPCGVFYVKSLDASKGRDTIKEDFSKSKSITAFEESFSNGFMVKCYERPTMEGFYVSECYKTEHNDWIMVLPKIILRLRNENQIRLLLDKYPSLVVSERDGTRYGLDCNASSSDDVLKVVSSLHEEKDVLWCEPDVLTAIKLCNSLYSQQYYLKNTGQAGGTVGMDINVEPAWNLITGNPDVTVAVIDNGVEDTHEDLSNCVLDGYTYGDTSGNGRPIYYADGHGMACAGIIAANNNSIGIKGIAYGVKILPVNVVENYSIGVYNTQTGLWVSGPYYSSVSEIASAIRWSYPRADILNCSWVGCEYSQNVIDAIYEARTQGRNGKGSIVVFASGNYYESYPDSTFFPSNVDGVISVGAIDRNGSVCNYSQRGTGLSLVAFGGYEDIVSTDRAGIPGYSTGNYYYSFEGTSAACSQVAGVVALMLSLNPDLTESQVRNILKNSCRKLSAYSYNNSGWSDQVGYGLIDARAAVVNALKAQTISGPNIPEASSIYSIMHIPYGCNVNWSWKSANTTIPITQNSPSANQCTISNSSKEYIVDTLVAVVTKNGNTIATFEKAINTGQNFYGTYEQEGADYVSTYVPECPSTTFHSGDRFILYKGATITLWSPKFVGATFSFDGNASPSNWTHNGNTITFHFHYLPPAPLQSQGETGMTRPLNVGMIVTGRYSNSYETFRFTIMPMLPMLVNPPSFLISSSGNIYTFTPSALNDETSMTSSNGSWNLIITNTLTGRVMYAGSIRGTSHTIDTSSWEEGVYAVQARVGETVLTQKFTVSK